MSHNTVIRRAIATAAGLALALPLAACGSDQSTPAPPDSPPTSASAVSASPTSETPIPRRRTITLQRGMTVWQQRAVLIHEAMHVARGDDGPQPERVERAIDEHVAQTLISPGDYAAAEAHCGRNTGAVAHDLQVPKWVVQAYRRILARALERAV